MAKKRQRVIKGRRVLSKAPIDRFDEFCIEETNLTGTIIEYDKFGTVVVLLDKHFDKLDEYNNCLIFPADEPTVLPDSFTSEFNFIMPRPKVGASFLYAGAILIIEEIKDVCMVSRWIDGEKTMPHERGVWDKTAVEQIFKNPTFYV